MLARFQDRFTLLDSRCELSYEFPEIEKGFVRETICSCERSEGEKSRGFVLRGCLSVIISRPQRAHRWETSNRTKRDPSIGMRLSREEKQGFPVWQLILHVRQRVFARRDSA